MLSLQGVIYRILNILLIFRLLIIFLFLAASVVYFLNLFLRGLNICNINISRCTKGIPAHPAAIVYLFIDSVRGGGRGVCRVQFVDNFLARCIRHSAYTGQWPHPAVIHPSFRENAFLPCYDRRHMGKPVCQLGNVMLSDFDAGSYPFTEAPEVAKIRIAFAEPVLETRELLRFF